MACLALPGVCLGSMAYYTALKCTLGGLLLMLDIVSIASEVVTVALPPQELTAARAYEAVMKVS